MSGETAPAKLVVPVDGLRNLTTDQSAVPEDYRPEIEKTGMYSYYCTNDVIQISPSGDAAAVSAGRENVDPVDPADGGIHFPGRQICRKSMKTDGQCSPLPPPFS